MLVSRFLLSVPKSESVNFHPISDHFTVSNCFLARQKTPNRTSMASGSQVIAARFSEASVLVHFHSFSFCPNFESSRTSGTQPPNTYILKWKDVCMCRTKQFAHWNVSCLQSVSVIHPWDTIPPLHSTESTKGRIQLPSKGGDQLLKPDRKWPRNCQFQLSS